MYRAPQGTRGLIMFWRSILAVSAAVVVGLAVPAVATAENAEWQATVLPLPAGYPDGLAWLTGTDGNGHYSGTLQHDSQQSVLLYNGSEPVVAGAPEGCSGAYVSDENSSRLVVGTAYNCDVSIYDQGFVYQDGTFTLLTPPGLYTMAWVVDV